MKKYLLILLFILSFSIQVKPQAIFADSVVRICPSEQTFLVTLLASGIYHDSLINITLGFDPYSVFPASTSWNNPVLYYDMCGPITSGGDLIPGNWSISWCSYTPISIPDGTPLFQVTMIYLGGSVPLILTDGFGTILSNTMVEPSVLSFIQQPNNITVYDGNPAQFSISTTFDYDVQYQWQVSNDSGYSWINADNALICSGFTTPVLTIDPAGYLLNGSLLRCMATGCQMVVYSDIATLTVLAPASLYTRLRYFSDLHQGVNNTAIYLEQNGIPVYSMTTDMAGEGLLYNLTPGTYEVVVDCQKPWAECNALDALEVMRHFVGLTTLTGLVAKTADVDTDSSINSIDALMMMKRFVGMINSFPLEDWIYEPHMITILPYSQNDLYIDIICAGDANQSYHVFPW